MKILFLVGATSRIRNFDHTILELADHGHVLQLAGRLRKGVFELPGSVRHERVSGRVNPTRRLDEWDEFVDLLRGARDYVRYFDPRYAQATRLVRRAYDIACVELVTPAQHVGLKRAWAKNGPGKSRRLHCLLRLEVVSAHCVASRTELCGA